MNSTKLFFIVAFLTVAGGAGCASTQTAQRQPDSVANVCAQDESTIACKKAKRELESPAQRYIGILETRGGR